MFTKEEMYADQAEFRLLVLISKYARDPWRRGKKGKTGGTTIELPTNTPALSKKQNKREAKNQSKQPREK